LGCGEGFLAPGEYVRWIEDENHGLRVRHVSGGYEFVLQFKPIEYIIAKQEKTDRLNASVMESERAEMKDMQYYTLSIQAEGGQDLLLESSPGNPEEYQKRVEYFSGQMQEDLKLIDGKDTFTCLLFLFEPSFQLRPFSNFLVAFEVAQGEGGAPFRNDKTLIYYDKMLGIEPVSLTIR
jgi:hypothetical protein